LFNAYFIYSIKILNRPIMAELDVQPKRKSPWLLWLVLALVLAAILFFLLRGCNKDDGQGAATTQTTTDSGAAATGDPGANGAVTGVTTPTWDSINFNAPAANYEEITNRDISIRGNDNYAIYSIGENILFGTDQSTIRPQAESNLKQLAASISKRFNGGEVRIYGHTDSTGSTGHNKELAEQRAAAVRDWLIKNGNITESRVSLHPVGESQPVASNQTAQGRQQNRRVEIVARRNQ
jgi:outer membrane protein OmpA-like peptidoglycan-associated protein